MHQKDNFFLYFRGLSLFLYQSLPQLYYQSTIDSCQICFEVKGRGRMGNKCGKRYQLAPRQLVGALPDIFRKVCLLMEY